MEQALAARRDQPENVRRYRDLVAARLDGDLGAAWDELLTQPAAKNFDDLFENGISAILNGLAAPA